MHPMINIALKAARDAAEAIAHSSDRLDRIKVINDDPDSFLTSMDLDSDIVTSGMAMYDTMQYINPDVSTIVMGQAASMGSLLAQAGAAGKRFVLPKSRTMIHQPSGGARGMASDIAIQFEEINRMKKDLTEIYVHHNSKGKTYAEFEAGMDRDNFLTAQEAVDWGLADEIITNRT